MPIKKSELYSSLWASCDELRGGMDAPQYKDYVLVLLFVKYVSDKAVSQKGYLLNGIPAMSKYAESATINPIEFERFGSPRSLNSNSVAFDEIRAARVPSYLQAGGLPAISRWLSEARAIPPERRDETQCIPKGCQREMVVRTGFRGGQMRAGLRSLRDRGVCGRRFRGGRRPQPPANGSHPCGMLSDCDGVRTAYLNWWACRMRDEVNISCADPDSPIHA